MGKSRSKNKKSRSFKRGFLDMRLNSDVAALVESVRETSDHIAERPHFDDDKLYEQNEKALEEAPELTVIYCNRVPIGMSADAFVKKLNELLVGTGIIEDDDVNPALRQSLSSTTSPILRCQLQPPVTKKEDRSPNPYDYALVTVCDYNIATYLVGMSPVRILNCTVRIKLSNRSSRSHGISPRSSNRDSVNCPAFEVGNIEVGHLKTSSLFHSLWNTHNSFYSLPKAAKNQFMDPLDAVLQINSASRFLSLTTKRPFLVFRSDNLEAASPSSSVTDERKRKLQQTHTRLRFEILFSSITSIPILQQSPEESSFKIVAIPVSDTPLLYREKTFKTSATHNDKYWDSESSNSKPGEWVRTVDPSKHQAISNSSTIRFRLEDRNVSALFGYLSTFGFNNDQVLEMRHGSHLLTPQTVHSCRNTEKLVTTHEVLARIKHSEELNIPFSIRYMVACIVSFKHVDLTKINTQFWKAIRYGTTSTGELLYDNEPIVLSVLEYMYIQIQLSINILHSDPGLFQSITGQIENDESTLIDPISLLEKCLRTCNIIPPPRSNDDDFGDVRLDFEEEPLRGCDTSYDGSETSDASSDLAEQEENETYVFDEMLAQLILQQNSDAMNKTSTISSSSASASSSVSDARRRLEASSSSSTSYQNTDWDAIERDGSVPKATKKNGWIRKVHVTPTRIIPNPPELELLNRILREFSDHQDRFIRVQFCDENGVKIALNSTIDLLAYISGQLHDGIYVAGDKFVFLAYSNSQLREGSCYFYNETPNPKTDVSHPPTADQIRMWMGDFSNIRIPGKYASRQGQTFSSTVSVIRLPDFYHGVISDVDDITGKYIFSDGVGLMKYELASEVASKLKMKKGGHVPSAFQIRFGGAKGMLTVWDEAFPSEGNPLHRVLLRPSMKKFETDHNEIEIVGYSRRIALFLNRQIITVLSGNGVPDDQFLKLQDKALKRLDKIMTEEGRIEAMCLLKDQSNNDFSQKLSSSSTGLHMYSFFEAGLNCVNCRFLFNMMLAYRRRIIRDMIQKSRIPVDYDKGLVALGVMDELGLLAPREIFVQYTDPRTGRINIVLGEVSVGRSPCLHPGDIQPVTAVYHPELEHLVDVIVFPRVGHRSMPSYLSGGDLDGDLFFVLSDSLIGLPQRHEITPMDYSPPKPVPLKRDVTWKDVANFFVEFIDNDCVGLVANAHVVHADKQDRGIFSAECLKLAQLHSAAVDFPKSGISVARQVRTEKLLPIHRANEYPDFMDKKKQVSYKSDRVLGKLYRKSVFYNEEQRKEEAKFRESVESKQMDELFEHLSGAASPGARLAEAIEICKIYNIELNMLMFKFGVMDEGEIVSGYILKFESTVRSFRDTERQHETQMRVNREIKQLRHRFRDEFHSDIDEGDQLEEIRKASLWYVACKRVAEEGNEDPPLLSFPWVVSDVLLPVIRSQLCR